MSEAPALKPCPFCGATPILSATDMWGHHYEYLVECGCGATGPLKDGMEWEDPMECIEAWNRRTQWEASP